MVNAKDAVAAATTFALGMYEPEELQHLRLEEIELSEDKQYWSVTLGWDDKAVKQHPLFGMNVGSYTLPRVYKLFRVDADTGAVLGMKIREVGQKLGT